MKRIFTLSLILSFISTISFAQIRIEKRHYNKGWYVSVKHKKNLRKEKNQLKENPVSEKAAQNELSSTVEEKPVEEIQTFSEIKNVPVVSEQKNETRKKQTPKIPIEKIKSVAAPVAEEIKTAVSAPVKKQQSFARAAKTKNISRADPGESFWEFLFDGLGEALLWSLVIIGALILVVYLLSLVLTPSAFLTFIGVLSLVLLILGCL